MISSTQLLAPWRLLRKNPATSVIAVVALGLGIGLTTSMFSLVYGVLLRPPPFADPGRLADLTSFDRDEGPSDLQSPEVSQHDFVDWQEQLRSFEDLAASNTGDVNLNDEAGFPERLRGGLVTWNAFSVLGVAPALGRDFTAQDDLPGAARVVLLGHDVWQSRFAGDASIVGRTIRLDGQPATVIGVMPPGFEFPLFEDLWQPLRLDVSELERGDGRRLWVVGRLRHGVSLGAAQAELATTAARQAEAWPQTNAGRGVSVRGYRQSLNSGANTAIMVVMFAAVSLVLVIACANVAGLLLARASVRARELAIRTSLGARRWRVAGLLLTESLTLSVLGSVLGLALAQVFTTWLESAFSWQTLPFWISFGMQPVAVVFVVAAGITAGLLSGILPALKASGAVTFELLKDESRGASSLRIGRLTRVLVVAELALACALLVATGLMVRTVLNYHDMDPGFASDSIFTAGLTLPGTSYPQPADAAVFYRRLVEDLGSLPEVEAAAVMSRPPGTFMGLSSYALEGEFYANQSAYPSAPRGVVSPEFFEVYGIRLVEGRLFDRRDDAESPLVVVVNQSFASQVWPGESAVGKRLRLRRSEPGSQGDGDEPWRSVVGVVPDAGVSLLNPAFVGTTRAGFYVPQAQFPRSTMSVAVKTRGEPSAFAATLRERVRRLDAGLPVDAEKTMQRVVWEQTFSTKVITVAFSFMGATALLLAAVGIFGVTLFSVEQRTREFGVRMALGARPADVLRLVLRQGMGRLAIGLALGLAIAWGLASAMRVVLYGVEPGDPLSFAGTVAVLAGAALLACYLPAWRAARVDPLDALHHE